MKKMFLFFVVLLLLIGFGQKSWGQKIVIGAQNELHLSIGYNLPIGPKSLENEVTLLANMKAGQSIEVRYLTSLRKNIYLGGWGGMSEFKGWDSPDNALYSGTTMTFLSVGPTVMYKPWSHGNSTTNKLNYCASLSPGISRLNVKTSSDSEINSGSSDVSLTVQSLRFTIGANAGLQYIFSNSVGATLLVGYQYTIADSRIFSDKSFSFLNVSMGIVYRLFKDRRYKYSGL